MFLLTVLVFVFGFKFGYCQRWQDRKPLLKIQQGLIEGISVYTDSSKIVNSFLGVPYAIPPVGNYRFLPPQKHPGWNGTYIATKHATKCSQLSSTDGIIGHEDCLYLNVWTPVNADSFGPLPVVVFFEGINFYKSSKIPFSAEDFAAEGVVVVTVSYRLNVFGFFCLGNEEVRGNMGLLDQYLAILWTKANAKQFGGDSDKITLFGHSSGAVSVVLHMVSPRTTGLFQRAIVSSGSAVSPWQRKNDATIASKQILTLLGCTSYNSKEYFTCLRSKTTEHILRTLKEYSQLDDFQDMFLPMVDSFLPENNRYLPWEPEKALQKGPFAQVPILTGIAKPLAYPEIYEWVNFAHQGYRQLQYFFEKSKIPEILKLYSFNSEENNKLFDLINWRFSPSTEDSRAVFDQIRNLEFEAKIEAPHYLQLSFLDSYVQPIFAYSMKDMALPINTTEELATTDLILLFGPSLLKEITGRRFTTNEARLSSYIKRLWINFINFGNPTPQPNRFKQWRKYTTSDPYVEEFDTKMTSIKEPDKDKLIQRVSFWNILLPKILASKPISNNGIPRELQKSREPGSFKHAMFTLIGLVLALLVVLVICIILLKKRNRERDRQIHLGY